MTKAKGKSPSSKPGASAAAGRPSLPIGPVTQLLIKSRQRIVNPERWARGAYARDALGNACNVQDEAAVKWCASGALDCEAGNSTPSWIEANPGRRRSPHFQAARASLDKAAKEVAKTGSGSLTVINDGGGHVQVMRVYNRAIVLAQGK